MRLQENYLLRKGLSMMLDHKPQAYVQGTSGVSFDELFSINNKYPQMKGSLSTSVVRCLKCYNVVVVYPDSYNASSVRTKDLKPYGSCKCSNVGCILDSQNTLRVYVEDLNSVHIGSAFLNSSMDVVKYYWGPYSESHLITPYHPVKNTGITFDTHNPPKNVTKSKKPVYVNTLAESLDLGATAQGRLFYYDTK